MSELKLDPQRTAVVVIDLQKGIVGRDCLPYSSSAVIAKAVKVVSGARRAGALIVLVHVGGAADGADRLFPAADQPMVRGALPPDWSELIPDLDRQDSDLVILKRQWGAFYGTDLDLQLRRRKVATVVLCGISTELGVESTARDAFERGYELVLVSDAMTGLNAESHADAVGRIFPRIGRVRGADEVVAAFA
ncbi:MAG: hydrolase [Syntrophobacteraceae bacterium]|nr:hydrolase [Syntrophobacteraceae bacterium]